jgi:hypothetical protein
MAEELHRFLHRAEESPPVEGTSAEATVTEESAGQPVVEPTDLLVTGDDDPTGRASPPPRR